MRKKKKIIFCIILIGVLLISFSYFAYHVYIKKNIVIAAVTMSGERKDDGISMMNGIKLLLEEVNKTGGIDGRKVVLKVFDDFGNSTDAINIANQISNDNTIRIVIGHFLSSCSLSAGRIYEKNGIPAITGSATSNNVTVDNKWYFSVIPDNHFQGSFIAYYINKILKKDAISIIYDKDSYGKTLNDSLTETARHIGLKINHLWGINAENLNIASFARELWNLPNNETIVMATHSPEAVKLISHLKYPGCKFSIFGTDSFSTSSFLNLMRQFPQESAIPGFYSDNIFAINPFSQETGSLKTINFIKSYLEKYNKEPSWVAATYYDAALTALEAIKRSNSTDETIRKSRHAIRDELSGMYNNDKAVKGVSGSIFFDRQGTVVKSLGVGYYKKGYFLPYYHQYQSIENLDTSNISFLSALYATFIPLKNIIIKQANIVYTGIKLTKIVNINFLDSTYDLEFLIWFRSKADFNEKDIVFKDAVNPIELGMPIIEETEGNVSFRMYHVRGQFKKSFMFKDFPFDTHMINVKFHHESRLKSSLIFVGDKIEYRQTEKRHKSIENPKWKIYKTHYFQDLHRFYLSATKFIDYSQFNMNWYIKKRGHTFILKTIAPILLLFVISYLITFVPFNRPGIRAAFNMLVFSAAFHYYLMVEPALHFGYVTKFDYLFGILFTYLLISTGFSIALCYISLSRRFFIFDKIFLPILFCLLGVAVVFSDISTTIYTTRQKDLNKKEQITNEWTFSVAENSEKNTLVGIVNLDDKSDDVCKYDIISGNDRQTFSINAQTGEIYVANTKQLDHELQNGYHLRVEIIDDSLKTHIGRVNIFVKDINEAPDFHKETFYINENIPLSSIVIPELNATDPEKDPISYSIISGNADGVFDMNPENGQLISLQAIDYESVPAYTLGVMAYDSSGLTAYQNIYINVKDINEPPVIKSQTFFMDINNCHIGKIIARDPESSPLDYKIVSQQNLSLFYIENNMLKVYDRVTVHSSNYSFIVEVSDITGLRSTAIINIKCRPVER
jgi:branched-chain amino acid transport system substrate-binding protein